VKVRFLFRSKAHEFFVKFSLVAEKAWETYHEVQHILFRLEIYNPSDDEAPEE